MTPNRTPFLSASVKADTTIFSHPMQPPPTPVGSTSSKAYPRASTNQSLHAESQTVPVLTAPALYDDSIKTSGQGIQLEHHASAKPKSTATTTEEFEQRLDGTFAHIVYS